MKKPGQPSTFRSVLERSTNKLWGCHFEVPDRVAAALVDGTSRRVFCSINGREEHQCALIPHGDGRFVITVNKKLQTELGLSYGAEVDVTLRKDDSIYGLPMPEELAELMRQDQDSDRLFHALTAGKQRTLLYIIGNGKTSDDRVRRTLVVTGHLKANKGKINFKQLNESLKRR